MEQTIREIIMQADDERNFDLIRWVKEILDEFASTHNCPLDWRHIGAVLAGEYPADSWVYENLELYNFAEIPEAEKSMKIALEVMKQLTLYFKEHLPRYTILETRKKSYHPDDSHLYMVSAKKDDGTYAVWTCWNQKTKSLNYGHYGLQSKEDCEKVMDEFYYSGDSLL